MTAPSNTKAARKRIHKRRRHKPPHVRASKPVPLNSPTLRRITPEAALRVIAKLGGMSVPDTIAVWQNTMAILAEPKKAYLHGAARKILTAISDEWRRRQSVANLDDYFRWPGTLAEGGDGSLSGRGWPAEGLLKFMGYAVGATNGKHPEIRRLILASIFSAHLPPVVSPDYMLQWATPSSALRLKKMAETLAALSRNAKRRHDDSMHGAVRDWERDLTFLHHQYYVGHFGFGWPSTSL